METATMTREEIKLAIKEKGIDRREIADRLGITYVYLNNMLNNFAALKEEIQDKIEQIIRE